MNRFKRIATLAGISILSLHFLLTIVYVSPYDIFPRLMKSASQRYIYPVFHQNWKLFAPEPPVGSQRLVIRGQFGNGQWSKWKDPGYRLLLDHQSNRFGYHGKLHDVYKSIVRNLHRTDYRLKHDGSMQALKEKPQLTETVAYRLAVKYALERLRQDYPQEEISQVELACLFIRVPDYENRNDQNVRPTVGVVRFPKADTENETGN